MRATLSFDGLDVEVDLSQPTDLSIKLDFDGPQPNAFGLPIAHSEPFAAGDFIGDVREGGSVNCENVFLNPHGNGTHTECVGHISRNRFHIADILQDTLIPAELVTVRTEKFGDSDDDYGAPCDDEDLVVTRASLTKIQVAWPFDALVLRTLPNLESKGEAHYSGNNPVYLTTDAMEYIRQLNVKHLLVDLPSVDREEDGGKLPNHHIFWEVPLGTNEVLNVPSPNTITEMIYVPNELRDGPGILSIQIPDFALDAAPSRVRWFAIEQIDG